MFIITIDEIGIIYETTPFVNGVHTRNNKHLYYNKHIIKRFNQGSIKVKFVLTDFYKRYSFKHKNFYIIYNYIEYVRKGVYL